MTNPSQETETTTALMSRLQAVLAHTDLDCGCKETIRTAIEHFTLFEQRRLTRQFVASARDQKERIVAILSLLQELNQITEIESDRSVFTEMAFLFDDIASSASAAAKSLRAVTDEEPV